MILYAPATVRPPSDSGITHRFYYHYTFFERESLEVLLLTTNLATTLEISYSHEVSSLVVIYTVALYLVTAHA